TASVVGTIFFVTEEAEQSTVGVIEGEVHVRRGEREIALRPGEQIESAAFVKGRFPAERVAWSRNSREYVALLAQTVVAPATPPPSKAAFEAISIRPNNSGRRGANMGPRGNRVLATGVTLNNLLLYAYRQGQEQFLSNQIVGTPGWADTEQF